MARWVDTSLSYAVFGDDTLGSYRGNTKVERVVTKVIIEKNPKIFSKGDWRRQVYWEINVFLKWMLYYFQLHPLMQISMLLFIVFCVNASTEFIIQICKTSLNDVQTTSPFCKLYSALMLESRCRERAVFGEGTHFLSILGLWSVRKNSTDYLTKYFNCH